LSDTIEEMGVYGRAHQLFTDFEKAYDSVRRELLDNILIEVSMLTKLVKPS